MAIQGLYGSGQFTTDMRPKNWREMILRLYPNGKAPLTALTSQMKTESTDDPEFNWFEKQYAARRFRTADATTWGAAIAPGTAFNLTLFTIVEASEIKAGDILMIEATGELLLVTANGVPGTGVVAAVHGWGQTGGFVPQFDADTVGVNPFVVVVGSAYAEGVDTPIAITYNPVKRYNYTQIFRRALDHTRTAINTHLRTGEQVKEARREALEHHGVDIEYAFFFGKPVEDLITTPTPRRTSGGILHYVTTDAVENVKDFGGDITMEELEAQMEFVFRWGAQEKMAFCGNGALLGIQQTIRKNSSWQFTTGEKEFGMNVTRLICPFGTIVFKTHPLFNVLGSGTTGGTTYVSWSNGAFILDMANLKYRPLKNSDTKYLPKRQGNGIDGEKSEYLTECGFEINHVKTHHVWKNMRRGIADT